MKTPSFIHSSRNEFNSYLFCKAKTNPVKTEKHPEQGDQMQSIQTELQQQIYTQIKKETVTKLTECNRIIIKCCASMQATY